MGLGVEEVLGRLKHSKDAILRLAVNLAIANGVESTYPLFRLLDMKMSDEVRRLQPIEDLAIEEDQVVDDGVVDDDGFRVISDEYLGERVVKRVGVYG